MEMQFKFDNLTVDQLDQLAAAVAAEKEKRKESRFNELATAAAEHLTTPPFHNPCLPTNPNINTIRLRQFYRQLLLNLQGTQELCLIQTVPENNKRKNSPKLVL